MTEQKGDAPQRTTAADRDVERQWSSDELRELLNQALALEFVKLKRRESNKRASFALLELFLKSAGGAALITILFGTLLGGLLAAWIQEKNKIKDESRARQQADTDRALENYKENLREERKTVEEAFSVAGNLIVRARDLIDLTGPNFNERSRDISELNRRLVSKQRRAMLQTYNDAHDTWQHQKVRVGLLLTIEHQNDRDTIAAWRETSQAVSGYAACCLEWLREHPEPANTSLRAIACRTRNDELQSALVKLTASIVAFRSKTAPQMAPK